MAITRSNKDASGQPALSPATWTTLDSALQKRVDSSALLEVSIYIPVCVGYKGAITTEQINAVATDLANKSTEGCVFKPIVFLAPRQKFPDEAEEPIDLWMKDNAEMLASHQNLQVVKSTDWRTGEKWLDAKKRHEQFLQNPGKRQVFEQFLEKDVSKYACFHPDKGPEAITQHIKDDMLDCISWMVSANDENQSHKYSVFIYQHSASEVMYHAFQHAKEMGYAGGLLHVKNLKFRQKVQQQSKPDEHEIDLHIRNAVANTPLETFFTGVTLGVLASGKDPTDAAKYLTELYFSISAQQSVASPSYANAGSSPPSRPSAVGMFGSSSRTQRTGTVVPLSSASAAAAANQDGPVVERSVGFSPR